MKSACTRKCNLTLRVRFGKSSCAVLFSVIWNSVHLHCHGEDAAQGVRVVLLGMDGILFIFILLRARILWPFLVSSPWRTRSCVFLLLPSVADGMTGYLF